MSFSRRDFIKLAGGGVGAVLLSQVTRTGKALASSLVPKKAMLYDASKCIGCYSCVNACQRQNKLAPGSAYTSVPLIQLGGNETSFYKRQCMHCTEASCEAVCPTGSISHQGEAVIINQNWCIGCGYCIQACPFNIPYKDEVTGTTRKCVLCVDRTSNGLEPACVAACPQHAVIYGDRTTLIDEGKKRVQALIANKVKKANLYGVTEMGGLGVLYVLLDSPSVYGLPEAPRLPTRNTGIDWLGGIFASGLLGLFPLWFIFRRKEKQEQETNKSPDKEL
jgi:formate dehydrogenase iron-sulfur subunit